MTTQLGLFDSQDSKEFRSKHGKTDNNQIAMFSGNETIQFGVTKATPLMPLDSPKLALQSVNTQQAQVAAITLPLPETSKPIALLPARCYMNVPSWKHNFRHGYKERAFQIASGPTIYLNAIAGRQLLLCAVNPGNGITDACIQKIIAQVQANLTKAGSLDAYRFDAIYTNAHNGLISLISLRLNRPIRVMFFADGRFNPSSEVSDLYLRDYARHEQYAQFWTPAQNPILCSLCQAETDSGLQYHDKPICRPCQAKIDNYEDRVTARYYRLTKAAEKAYSQAEADEKHAHAMASVIPFGQPILVGHYSEKRDRNYREKIHNTFDRAYKGYQRAERLAQRARSAEDNRAISSDDPTAILKLQEKIEALESLQESMRKANRAMRTVNKLPLDLPDKVKELSERLDCTIEKAANLLTPDFCGRLGYADYQLTNNNANIKRLKARIAELKYQTAKKDESWQYGDIEVTRNTDLNRIQISFPGKPGPEIIKTLKANGFHWTPSQGVWQRLLNDSAEYHAKRIASIAAGKES